MANDKIIIAAEGIKREVPIPFAICCSRRTLEIIAARLDDALAGDPAAFVYGWVDIYPKPDVPTSTPPSPWSENTPT